MIQNMIPKRCTVFFVVSIALLSTVTIAFPAAAAVTDSDRTATTTQLSPGDEVTVTVSSQLDGEGTGYNLEESISGPVDRISVDSVTVDDASAGTIVESTTSDGLVVTLADQNLADVEVAIEYTITANSSEGTIEITDGESSSASAGTTEISVVEDPLIVDQTLERSELEPGESTNLTTTIENPSTTVSLEESFQPAFDSATVLSVGIHRDGSTTPVDPTLAVADGSGSTVTVDGLSSSDTLVSQTELTVPDDADVGTVITIESNVTAATAQATAATQLTIVGAPEQRYAGDDGSVDISDLGTAASDYAAGNLSISELGAVAAAYATG